ncbi:MAG: ATP-dependent DNA helicase RecG [Nitrospinae bacterium]|nr:ATP-dependent DNA helicase RecG [Nitrospinota bacterium]
MIKRSLDDPVQFIKGVGPKRAVLLDRLSLRTVEDCLYFLPRRYEDRSRVRRIAQLTAGEQSTFEGKIVNAGTYAIGRRKKIFEVILQDETGVIRAKWFRFNEKYFREKYRPGLAAIVSGKPAFNRRLGSGLEIVHPDMEIAADEGVDALEIGRVVPVYPTTEGLHPKAIRKIMKHVVDEYAPLMEEILPEDIVRKYHLPPVSEALRFCHFPPEGGDVSALENFRTPEQERLIFEELYLLQLGLAHRKKLAGQAERGNPLRTRGDTVRRFVKLLQFELTGAQKKALAEIMDDLEKERPMNRLLFGDVGSGKTAVALTSLLTAVDNGFQGALMAPTELLAEQHYLNIRPYCEKLGVTLELATSAATQRERKKIQESIQDGTTQIAVGTHALIQRDVQFRNLGLAVIDEQHRFGVLQREAIAKKGFAPHVLVMTATPIPRSLALTLYGDMDVSVLDELPPGRKPIATQLFHENRREEAYDLLRREIAGGGQAYVVCPLIEESEALDMKTVIEIRKYLQEELFPGRRVGLIHGKMKKEERQQIMSRFKAGEIDILTATTVIEVGIDVPNATVMIVEHAERFGLSQLHQLRGRVGRGGELSHCLLMAYHPLSEEARARLNAMLKTGDGFAIAEEDLAIRGPGDFMGTRQSGLPSLRIANLARDIKIIEKARKEAFDTIDQDPCLDRPAHRGLKRAFQKYFGDRIKLMDVI